MNTTEILKKVSRSIEILIKAGEPYEGLFPSLLDLKTHEMLKELPAPIAGQRKGDRSYPGSNLIHDESTLLTMYGLSKALSRPDFAAAADRYLKRFATHCTATATGLFPWGEHAYWDLVDDQAVGIHDHLRQAPVWLWEKLFEFNPKCVETFGEGLDFHWMEDDRKQYWRHAEIVVRKRMDKHARACDFPRHGGFYLLDWCYAYAKTGRADFMEQIDRIADYWWLMRDETNLLLGESRTPPELWDICHTKCPGQTLSLGTSMLDSADVMEAKDPQFAAELRNRARAYTDGFFYAPHDLEAGIYVLGCACDTNAAVQTSPIWGSAYGIWPASYTALTCLATYRYTKDQRLWGFAESVGRGYLREPMPGDVKVPAMDAGLGLGLLADLYDISGDRIWLDGGLKLADQLMSVYFDGDLLRSAAGIDWYESQMGPGFLLHGLSRIALLAQDKDNCPVQPDYTAR